MICPEKTGKLPILPKICKCALDVDQLRHKAAGIEQVNEKCRCIARRKVEVLSWYHYQCAWCGSGDNLTIDHGIPVRTIKSLLGTSAAYARWNRKFLPFCQILCRPCHDAKNSEEVTRQLFLTKPI
ncbi:hypothetical protein HY642_05295 [Candidatus Woesearchaeota archaeon]|nr:hypothetical protein [Candidatus Woesearchaeota archaeon]